MSESLSIIVPVRNAEATITSQVEQLLDMLPDLTQHFDIVIVDDASLDHTVDLARELACAYPQVRLIRHAAPQGREHAIHTGRTWAQGKVILAPEYPAAFLSPTELQRQWQLQRTPLNPPITTPSSPPVLQRTLSARLTKWGQALRPAAAEPVVLTNSSARADDAHPVPPYLHHAAAFLEHLTKLALGE